MPDIENAFEFIAKLFFGIAAFILFAFAVALLGVAGWHLVSGILLDESLLTQTLESIGLVTIGIAVFDVAKFLVEEEIIRSRERRAMMEARGSLTKFFTIVIVALSIESIVLVFETKLENLTHLLYPTALMAVAILALIGLGLFQHFTRPDGHTEREDRRQQAEDET